MSMEVTVIDRTPFVDRTDPNKPINKIQITFQTADGRIGTTSILATDVRGPNEDKAIAESIKKLPERTIERKTIKL